MVAKTPTKEKKMAAALNPNLIKETVMKMDRCMARLQELQYTVTGGNKVISGVSLSPRSTRGYLRTSLRCKQESIRTPLLEYLLASFMTAQPMASYGFRLILDDIPTGEWRRMSLPAMLVRETVAEILQASRFTKEVANAVAKANQIACNYLKTPETGLKKSKPLLESTRLQAKRKKEKQGDLQLVRSESKSPTRSRVRSRIQFKVSPPRKPDLPKENRHLANRVSPKNRPWAKKTVLFPNPLFLSSPTKQQHKFCKTRSPVIAKARQTPHKFLIKSPPALSKFPAKNKNPTVLLSPTRLPAISKLTMVQANTTTTSMTSKLWQSFSPAKLRRSFSPSKFANRLVSPLKSRNSVQKTGNSREKWQCMAKIIGHASQFPEDTSIKVSNKETRSYEFKDSFQRPNFGLVQCTLATGPSANMYGPILNDRWESAPMEIIWRTVCKLVTVMKYRGLE
ncbi:hypothetical protein ACLOJK_016615 [Asimina triloba]